MGPATCKTKRSKSGLVAVVVVVVVVVVSDMMIVSNLGISDRTAIT